MAEEPSSSFAFDIPPSVKAGVTLKVQAPDGVQLHIPLPASVMPGDRMVMQKNPEDGKWGIKHVVRNESPAENQVATKPDTGTDSQPTTLEQLEKDLNAPYVCHAHLKTTKGIITVRVMPSWAPKGSQRFLQLISDQYYTDLAIYRAVPGFLVQFGVTNDTVRTNKYTAIEDDEVRGIPIVEGMVCFAAAGAHTRTATLCIFLGEFPQLGQNPWETPIGKITDESLSVLRSIYTGYGDMPQCGGTGPDPILVQDLGNDYIKEEFPKCDFVESATWECPS